VFWVGERDGEVRSRHYKLSNGEMSGERVICLSFEKTSRLSKAQVDRKTMQSRE